MIEEKEIVGYEGLYTIDILGRVYSIKRKRYLKGGTLYSGHKTVLLSKDGKGKTHSVHRLVAQAFIPNPKNLPIVHHIDENPQNNAASNLQWCTQKENVHHTIASGKHGTMRRSGFIDRRKQKIGEGF